MGTRAYSHYISISHRREKIHIFPLIKRVLQCIFFFWGERESGLFLVDKNTYMVRDKLSKKGNPYEHYTNKESRESYLIEASSIMRETLRVNWCRGQKNSDAIFLGGREKF